MIIYGIYHHLIIFWLHCLINYYRLVFLHQAGLLLVFAWFTSEILLTALGISAPLHALTSVVGKVFHKILATRLVHYLLSNSIVDTSVQASISPSSRSLARIRLVHKRDSTDSPGNFCPIACFDFSSW